MHGYKQTASMLYLNTSMYVALSELYSLKPKKKKLELTNVQPKQITLGKKMAIYFSGKIIK